MDSTAAPSGLTHKYTTLLKDRSVSPDRNYTTKILIGTDADIRRERVFQYSDDDDVGRYHIRQDRSVSPEVRPLRQQQQQQQQRSRNSDSSPEATERKQLSSTRLIQEAERGRNVGIRRPQTINSSRLVQQAYREDSIQEPPVAPIRTKKLRERMETSPPRAERSGMRVGFNANVDSIPPWKQQQQQQQQQRWKHRKNSESSRERSSSPRRPDDFHAEFHDGPEGYVYAPRYHPASVDPRFARRYHPEEEEEAEMDNVRLG